MFGLKSKNPIEAANPPSSKPHARPAASRLAVLLIVGVLICCAALAFTKRTSLKQASSAASPNYPELDRALLTAIRNGEHKEVADLMRQGADVNARTEFGDTALMQAACNSDCAMTEQLLERGADVNARGIYDVTPLLRAIHEYEKVRLLLRHGAKIDARMMVIAAMVSGSRRTLEQLAQHGANINASVGEFTPLMAASYCGDLEAAAWLIDQGADVKARTNAGCTALNGAAVAGNAAIVKLLLEHGADPNVRYEEPDTIGDFQTPLMNAAWKGHADCVKLLLEHGADVNVQGGPFKRTPLLCAATNGSVETIRLLVAKGANMEARDWSDATPRDWAKRRGDSEIIALLQPGSRKSTASSPSFTPGEAWLHASTPGKALQASMPLLQRSGQRITQTKSCVTCHQHSLVAMTVGLARQHGFAVDEEIAAQEREAIAANLGKRLPMLMLGAGIDPTLAAYTLAGFAAEDRPPTPLTDALVHYLVLHQQGDGHWPIEAYRPPEDGSSFLFTALAVRGLKAFAPQGRSAEMADCVGRARAWLAHAQPAEMVDRSSRLLGLASSGASTDMIAQAARELSRQQHADGGWSQLPTLPSDAHATGQALFALHEAAGMPVNDTVYQKGLAYLFRTQRSDGSWYVPTRCFPVLEFSSSGFPHGKAQFISAAATCWATMALAETGAEK